MIFMQTLTHKNARYLLQRKISFKTSANLKKVKKRNAPSPLSLPLIGTLHQYFPIIGSYSSTKLHEANMKKYKKFGPIIKENLTYADPPLLNLFHPDDFEAIFRAESKNPSRLSHLALEEYRIRKKGVYNTGGLLPTNGKEWWRLRKAFQKGLSSPKDVRMFLPAVDGITMEWVESIKIDAKLSETFEDFLQNLWSLFIELAGWVILNYRFKTESTSSKNKALKLVEAALTTNFLVPHTDIGPKLWKRFDTKPYRKLKEAQNYMEEITLQMLNEQKLKYSEDVGGKPLALRWLELPEVDEKDVLAMAVDFLLAGIDTSSNTSSFLLYYISKDPKIQSVLFEESIRLLPKTSSVVTEEILEEAKYTKVALKEALRLNPISIGIGRLLTEDRVIQGYHIPKGVNVLTNNQVACRLEENFHNPLEFIPERWIRNDPLHKQSHPFLLLPFGYGSRACIARRLAEQNILTLTLKLVRNFHLHWEGGELDSKCQLINKPDKPVRIRLVERSV